MTWDRWTPLVADTFGVSGFLPPDLKECVFPRSFLAVSNQLAKQKRNEFMLISAYCSRAFVHVHYIKCCQYIFFLWKLLHDNVNRYPVIGIYLPGVECLSSFPHELPTLEFKTTVSGSYRGLKCRATSDPLVPNWRLILNLK